MLHTLAARDARALAVRCDRGESQAGESQDVIGPISGVKSDSKLNREHCGGVWIAEGATSAASVRARMLARERRGASERGLGVNAKAGRLGAGAAWTGGELRSGGKGKSVLETSPALSKFCAGGDSSRGSVGQASSTSSSSSSPSSAKSGTPK